MSWPETRRWRQCRAAWRGTAPGTLASVLNAVVGLLALLASSSVPVHAPPSATGRVPAAVPPHHPGVPDSALRITFLDVGQGDAVLIHAPGGQVALVDAGPGDIVPLLRGFGVTRIDLLVATHPHADHIGGMAGVIETFPVRFHMDNGQPHTTATYRRLLAALDARPQITYLEAYPRTLALGEVDIEVLPLLPPGTTELNDRSIALVVRYGSFTAFLSGDSGVRQLSHLVGQGVVPRATLLKAPHHGSDDGYTWEFLDAARPRVVVISAGRNNRYGHPRPAALSAFRASGATVFRTDRHGHVSVAARENGDYTVAYGGQVALRGDATDAVSAGAAGGAGIRLSVHADAPGNDHRNPNGEYAVLESLSSEDRMIGGWTLCDLANHCFTFPAGAVLAAGGRLFVHTGSGSADGTRYYMGRRQAVWNNRGDTATLYDGTGAVLVVFDY
ncbi:MBL fold metallo-hydrolase [Candidatus Palauibacter sp.]|uniref:MBL fold metallo-hydrolase n=1 Tax=Candidatus Palauibacter sp. TaxID=3101350 RepID=UPI003B02A063